MCWREGKISRLKSKNFFLLCNLHTLFKAPTKKNVSSQHLLENEQEKKSFVVKLFRAPTNESNKASRHATKQPTSTLNTYMSDRGANREREKFVSLPKNSYYLSLMTKLSVEILCMLVARFLWTIKVMAYEMWLEQLRSRGRESGGKSICLLFQTTENL